MNEERVKEVIHKILMKAMESGDKFAFPIIYKSLKEEGIISYSYDFESGRRVFTYSEGKIEEQEHHSDFVYGEFNTTRIREALERHQTGETSYDEWLKEMAHAGVWRYIVTMNHNMTIYLDQSNTQIFVEAI